MSRNYAGAAGGGTPKNVLGSLPGRKQLERERLARLGKRQGEESETENFAGRSSRPRITSSFEPQYLDGCVKLTYVEGFVGDYVRFEDLVQKSRLRRAFLSTFMIDWDWLSERLPKDVNVVIAKHWVEGGESKAGVFAIPDTNFVIVHPRHTGGKDRPGTFHAKTMLLFFDGWLRVVIGSANLVPYDWKEMENALFIQDFPLLDVPTALAENLPPFASVLYNFLNEMGAPKQVGDKLLDYDFQRAKAVLVPSVAGQHVGVEAVKTYGHPRLSEAVRLLGCASDRVIVECQTSSLGRVDHKYLADFYHSAKGRDSGLIPRVQKNDPLPPITIVYPTTQTVDDSKYGRQGAGTICFSKSQYELPTFPKQILRDCLSLRERALMHSKFILARIPVESQPHHLGATRSQADSAATSSKVKDAVTPAVSPGGWYYCGSHNFTAAAWGKVTRSAKTKEIQLFCYNWELGAVLPLDRGDVKDADANGEWFSRRGVPVPYLRLPPEYGSEDVPWTGAGFG